MNISADFTKNKLLLVAANIFSVLSIAWIVNVNCRLADLYINSSRKDRCFFSFTEYFMNYLKYYSAGLSIASLVLIFIFLAKNKFRYDYAVFYTSLLNCVSIVLIMVQVWQILVKP